MQLLASKEWFCAICVLGLAQTVVAQAIACIESNLLQRNGYKFLFRNIQVEWANFVSWMHAVGIRTDWKYCENSRDSCAVVTGAINTFLFRLTPGSEGLNNNLPSYRGNKKSRAFQSARC
jgi:hypothetical protein